MMLRSLLPLLFLAPTASLAAEDEPAAVADAATPADAAAADVLAADVSPAEVAPAADVAPAPADDDVDLDAARETGEITKNGVSARFLFGTEIVPDEDTAPLVGFGVAYERSVFFDLLAVELALETLASPTAQAYVAEFVVEKPIELNDSIGLYFGGGPTIGVKVASGRAIPGAGLLAMAGVEVVIAGGLEVFVELDAAAFSYDTLLLETDVGTGLLYRF